MARKVVVVVLAAGEGKRMRSSVPKVLIDLLGRSILGHVVDAARALRPESIIVVGGRHLPAMRKAFKSEPGIRFVRQSKPLGTGHAVRSAMSRLPKAGADVVILNGDCPLIRGETLRAMVAAHRRKKCELLAATAVVADPSGLGRIVRSVEGSFLGIVEEKDATESEQAIREINAGQYVVSVEALRDLLPRIGRKNVQGEYYLTDLVTLAKGRSWAFLLEDTDEARGINRPAELAEARAILKARLVAFHEARGVSFDDPSLVHLETGVEIGEGTRIRPFVVLSRGVTIAAHCVVGPFSHLRDGASLGEAARVGNFVEVKASSIGAGSRVLHLSYLGDAHVGSDANVGAGVITANFDGRRKWPTRIEDHASIGAGTILVAPVKVGRRGRTGAGAVVPRDRDVLPGDTVVGVPARPIGGRPPRRRKK